MKSKYIFGPVFSRRLGTSLGIDLLPYKTCTFNCVYCECGTTTKLTEARKEYVPTEDVITELNQYLKTEPNLDYITFSGSGEPTMHTGIKKIIDFLKHKYPDYKIALLTNGTLFKNKNVINEVINSDLIIPSLDAISEPVLQKINRPLETLNNQEIISGIVKLSRLFNGEIWLEIFIIPGLNDTEDEIKLLDETIKKIKPEKIQLNTLSRPGTEDWVKSISKQKLNKIASFLGKKTEIIKNNFVAEKL